VSACISWHGEYGEHEHGTADVHEEFICSRCGAFDEDAALAEIERLRRGIDTDRADTHRSDG